MTINRKVSGRDLRRQLAADAEMAAAAAANEQVTRRRVDTLEQGFTAVAAIVGRGFWGRFQWLVFGR